MGCKAVVPMKETVEIREVSDKIKKKITTGNYPNEVKEFLLEMLVLELAHMDEERPRLNDDYETKLKSHALKCKEV